MSVLVPDKFEVGDLSKAPVSSILNKSEPTSVWFLVSSWHGSIFCD